MLVAQGAQHQVEQRPKLKVPLVLGHGGFHGEVKGGRS
jgi:hypothetical protein